MLTVLNDMSTIAAEDIIDVTPEDEFHAPAVKLDKKNFNEWLKGHDDEIDIRMAPIQIVERDVQAILAEKQSDNSKSKKEAT